MAPVIRHNPDKDVQAPALATKKTKASKAAKAKTVVSDPEQSTEEILVGARKWAITFFDLVESHFNVVSRLVEGVNGRLGDRSNNRLGDQSNNINMMAGAFTLSQAKTKETQVMDKVKGVKVRVFGKVKATEQV